MGTSAYGDEISKFGKSSPDKGEVVVEEGVGGAGTNAARNEEDVKGRGSVEGVCGENGFGEGGVKGVHCCAAGGSGDGVEGRGDEAEF